MRRQPCGELSKQSVAVGAAPARAKIEPLRGVVRVDPGAAVVADGIKSPGIGPARIEGEIASTDDISKGGRGAACIDEIIEEEDRHIAVN